MPKKSSGSAASVEGFVSYSILLDLIQDTKTSADERSFLHLTTLAENLETVYILISCKYLYLQRNSKAKIHWKDFLLLFWVILLVILIILTIKFLFRRPSKCKLQCWVHLEFLQHNLLSDITISYVWSICNICCKHYKHNFKLMSKGHLIFENDFELGREIDEVSIINEYWTKFGCTEAKKKLLKLPEKVFQRVKKWQMW